VDIHSHAVPSGDDGAQTLEDGVLLCEDAARHGTVLLYATPHVWPHLPLWPEREQAVRTSYEELRGRVPLELRLGYELTPTRDLLEEDPRRYVLEGTDAVLVEVPFAGPADLVFAVVDHAQDAGLRVAIAHPERTEAVVLDRRVAIDLAESGCLLQVNATSLLGYHGETSAELGWSLLEEGIVAIVASDGHRLARPAQLDAAYDAVAARVGEEAALPLFDGSALGLASRRPAPSRGAVPGA
jgi:protein-tyrosine phosphatase